MPSRLLREGILDSEAVNTLSLAGEIFYRRLMSVVDDYGRFDGRPSVLRSRLYPLRVDTVREADIAAWVGECAAVGLIVVYTVDSRPYIQFHKLGPPRAKDSKYPAAPTEADANSRPVSHTDANGGSQPFTSENGCAQPKASVPYSYSDSDSDSDSDSINTPLPPKGGEVEDGTSKEKKARKPKAAGETVPIPPDLDREPFRAAWAEWLRWRAAEKRKPVTAGGAERTFKSFAGWSPEKAAFFIDRTISRDYQGIYSNPAEWDDANNCPAGSAPKGAARPAPPKVTASMIPNQF